MPPEFDFPKSEVSVSTGQTAIKARCAACQLQLCKSRSEPPHGALKESGASGGFASGDTVYTCTTCGTTLVRSADPVKAGWSQRRS